MSPQERIARVFSALLVAELGVPIMEEVVGTNNMRKDGSCASHDYRDANCFMALAFTLTGHDPEPTDTALWNEAWATAKTNQFYINNILPEEPA